jgi:CheY-like chemotaxis protein
VAVLTALDDLAEHRFDLILTDLNLPDSEGLDTLMTLRRYAAGVPIVVRSSARG